MIETLLTGFMIGILVGAAVGFILAVLFYTGGDVRYGRHSSR